MLHSRGCQANAVGLIDLYGLVVIYPLPPTPSETLRALGVSAFSCVTPRFWVLFKNGQISCNLHLGCWGACSHSCPFFHSSIPVLFFIFCSQEMMTSLVQICFHRCCAISFTNWKDTFLFSFVEKHLGQVEMCCEVGVYAEGLSASENKQSFIKLLIYFRSSQMTISKGFLKYNILSYSHNIKILKWVLSDLGTMGWWGWWAQV